MAALNQPHVLVSIVPDSSGLFIIIVKSLVFSLTQINWLHLLDPQVKVGLLDNINTILIFLSLRMAFLELFTAV